MPRCKDIALSPTALDRNGLSASETLAATGLEFTLGGVLAANFDRDGLAAAQTPTAAGNLTLNGASIGSDFRSFTPGGIRVSLYGANDESGKTFTVTGTDTYGNTITESIVGPNADVKFGSTHFYTITTVATDAATTGDVEVGHQGSVTLSTPQHITVYSAGDDTSRTFTVTGTDRYGNSQTENITGVDGDTALGTKNFKTVTSVVSDDATAGAAEVGIDGLAESQWYICNYRGEAADLTIGVTLSSGASLTYALQECYEDLLDQQEDQVSAFTDGTITGKTANFAGSVNPMPRAVRLALTAFTSGTATLHIVTN